MHRFGTVARPAWIVALALAACGGEPAPPSAPPPAPIASATAAPPPKPKVPYDDPGGMWPPGELAGQAAKLSALGLEIDPKALTDPLGAPLGAVVSLGGCSASFVSPDGLVATNHHCVIAALQYNSTPEHNLLRDGFHAKGRADERWAGPTQRLYVTRAFRDVTSEVRAGLEDVKSDVARERLVERRVKDLVAACEKGRPSIRCSVPAFYGGGQYLLVEQLEIRDVRLVFAPPESVGDFGGEIDNWRWPREAGDVSLYRAYVGPDQKPADHADTNVPYRPPHHLRVASHPLEAGDLVFVAGYPAVTNRLRTAAEVEEAVSFTYPHRVRLYEDNVALLERLSKTDATIAIKATPMIRRLDNALTKTRGLMDGLVKGGLEKKKQELEAALASWIEREPTQKARYGGVLEKMRAVFAARDKTREEDAFLDETARLVRLYDAALTIVRMAEERPKPDAERDADYQQRNWQRLEQEQIALERRYDRRMDAAVFALALERDARLDKAKRSPLLALVAGRGEPTTAAIEEAVGKLYAGTKLEDTATRVRLLKGATLADLKKDPDPLVKLAVAARPLYAAAEDRAKAAEGALELLRPRYVAALRAFSSNPVAPDANRTLRVSYGTVKGYRPRPDAPVYRPFTTLAELAQKATGKPPFDAPKPLLDAIAAKLRGPYAARELGDVPVDFLADLDITGGNSGSPTLDARGELVGLAFDGDYEAMASDWLFMPDVTRSIHVDVRYVLWLLDAVYGADELVREMGATPSLP